MRVIGEYIPVWVDHGDNDDLDAVEKGVGCVGACCSDGKAFCKVGCDMGRNPLSGVLHGV